jgi:hypothetical protein
LPRLAYLPIRHWPLALAQFEQRVNRGSPLLSTSTILHRLSHETRQDGAFVFTGKGLVKGFLDLVRYAEVYGSHDVGPRLLIISTISILMLATKAKI